MNKQTIALILGIFLFSFASAMYSGDTQYKDLTTEIENLKYFDCNLTAQTYNLEGSNFTMNSTGWILSLDIGFKPDNLTVDCLLNGEKYVSSSSSHSKSYYTWDCSSWGDCTDDFVSRNCIKQKVYYKTILGDKPDEYLECEKMNIIETKNEEKDSISPDPIETPKKMPFIKILFWIILIITLSFLTYFINKKRKEIRNKQLKENSKDLSKKIQNDKN